MTPIRQHIIDRVEDLVGKLMYYDRKEDEELGVGDIEKAVKDKLITVDEIIDRFRSKLEEALED